MQAYCTNRNRAHQSYENENCSYYMNNIFPQALGRGAGRIEVSLQQKLWSCNVASSTRFLCNKYVQKSLRTLLHRHHRSGTVAIVLLSFVPPPTAPPPPSPSSHEYLLLFRSIYVSPVVPAVSAPPPPPPTTTTTTWYLFLPCPSHHRWRHSRTSCRQVFFLSSELALTSCSCV